MKFNYKFLMYGLLLAVFMLSGMATITGNVSNGFVDDFATFNNTFYANTTANFSFEISGGKLLMNGSVINASQPQVIIYTVTNITGANFTLSALVNLSNTSATFDATNGAVNATANVRIGLYNSTQSPEFQRLKTSCGLILNSSGSYILAIYNSTSPVNPSNSSNAITEGNGTLSLTYVNGSNVINCSYGGVTVSAGESVIPAGELGVYSYGAIRPSGPDDNVTGNFSATVDNLDYVVQGGGVRAPVSFGVANSYTIIAKTTITDANPSVSVITGNVTINPAAGSFITGMSCTKVNGTIYSSGGYLGGYDTNTSCAVTDPVEALAARSAMEVAYNDASGRTLPDTTELGSGEIGGLTITPGLHKWSTAVTISNDVVLDCQGNADAVFIFQMSSTLAVSNGKRVNLTNGCQAANIFWQANTGVTLGTTAVFNGNILAGTAITIQTGAVLNGRAFAQSAVTLDGNLVTIPVAEIVDILPPVITLNTANNSWTSNNQTSFNFTSVDALSATANCSLFVDGVLGNFSINVSNNVATLITPNVTLSQGAHTWYVNCTDLSGNVGTSTSNGTVLTRVINIDSTNPTVNLITTNATWTNNNQSSFSFNYTDALSVNATCDLFVDDILLNVSLVTLNNTNTAITPNITLADGTRTWYVNCTDLAGNVATSTPRLRYVDIAAPTVNSLTPADNAWNNSATPVFTFNYTDALASTSSCVLYINSTAYGTNSSVTNNTNTAITANTSLTSGNYNWQVNCTDLATNLGNSTVRTIKVDVTSPVSTINSINSQTSSPGATTNATLIINFTATDANIQNWTVRIYNSSFGLMTNISANTSNTSSIVTYGTGANGTYYVNLTTLDNATNSNTTSFTIYVDQVSPAINSLAVSSATTTGGTLTVNSTDALSGVASCNYSGAGTGSLTLSSGLYTASLSGLTASTSYTVNVTCLDTASNVQSNTTTFTTSAAAESSSSSSSSGGGGSGATGTAGGVSNGIAGQFEKKVWTSVNKGETATVSVKDGTLGVTGIEFTTLKTVWGAWVQVSKKDKLPSTILARGSNVYTYLEITRSSTLTDDTLKEAKINFKVDKSWLAERKLSPEQISLFHYKNGQWTELKTTVASQDGSYAYYSAQTPGFSYFAIAQNMVTAAPIAEVVAPVVGAETTPVETTPILGQENVPVEEKQAEVVVGESNIKTYAIIAVVALVLIVGLVLFLVRKRNNSAKNWTKTWDVKKRK